MAAGPKFSTLGADVADLQAAAADRLLDAEALFAAGRFASAIAMGLYSLEIQLKVWVRVTDYLEHSMKQQGDIGFSIGLSVHTFDQVAKGGRNSIPEGYVEEEILLGPGADEGLNDRFDK